MTTSRSQSTEPAAAYALGPFAPAVEYMTDAAQRAVLFLDVLRQSGNQYREHLAETAPHVLDYQAELVVDGRSLARPVNYALARPAEGCRSRSGAAPLCRGRSARGARPGDRR